VTHVPAPGTETYAAAIARAERAERLAAERIDALAAVREAIGIPYAATVGEDETVRTPILLERVMALSVFLDQVLREDGPDWLVPHSVAYLRERLGEHPAEGYKTWDAAVADLKPNGDDR